MKNNENPKVRLRRLSHDDATVLARLADNRKIFDNLRDVFPSPYTEKDAEEFICYCMKEDPPLTFAIEYQGALAGVNGLILQKDIYRKTAEIGYWIGEPYWGSGIATSALNQLVDYAFGNLDLVRLHTGVFDYNKASRRVLEKCGFILEGIFKNSVFKNGKVYDEYRYAKLK
jgi:[ribosomal protein S5]-alanine N-acetyltransferase